MKKFLYTIAIISMAGSAVKAQTSTPTNTPVSDPVRKVRFGLRVTPQPTWLASGDKNATPSGANFGFGFGLNMEFRLNDVASLQTGIGGDFEGGKYTFRNDASYKAMYFLDESNTMIAPKSGNAPNVLKNEGTTGYVLKERTLKTTFVTIPVILKLSTKEYNGFKYFGMFGGEIGIRAGAHANDSYYTSENYDPNGNVTTTQLSPPDQSQINLNKDASLIPLRVGLNVGAGSEYRLGGTTSIFVNVNFFHSFINTYRSQSKYLVYKTDPITTNNTDVYKFVQQAILLNAVRINIGIMF